ncbi:copper amine oxidase N-terminal domain-containing protein [Saccharibacillus sp. CPCC 101409]|uniref:copper amine oxidase N-terminal domain-containing protein n=1 Tax=Saccharibacillus sp. CPCC 101409 TaxID=3058041 RepID=UPI002673BF9A|nr:copper amine oxidase N-terminal domain-containing protein [Saccharibacillus sp. CPCC 101409]MDO3411116.1 copper amine oxidase N-terminal domain-containing protein [Saccharibacillus sp. CPCC 101409]
MKKILIASLLGSAVLGASAAQAAPATTPAAAAKAPAATTTASEPAAMIYGNDGMVTPSAYPYFIKSTLYATADVIKQLDIDGLSISWDNKTKSYTYMKDDHKVVIKADSNVAWVDGKEVKLQGSATFKRGVLRVPVGVIVKGVGEKAVWDKANKTLWIGDSIK